MQFGAFEFSLETVEGGVPRDSRLLAEPRKFFLPAVLSYPECPSLLFKTEGDGRDAAAKVMQNVMLRLLTSMPPGKVRFTIVDRSISEITEYIDGNDTIEGAPHMRDADLAVFDCAFKPANGSRSIEWRSHVKMMAAAQPFLSGAISKTVNMPQETTPEEIN